LNTPPKERLRQIFESTIDSGEKYSGNIEDIDYYALLCKSTANNQLYKIFSCNLSMYNYSFKNEDSVIMVFSIPTSINNNTDNQTENKHISERIMDVLKVVEDCFVTVDYMDLKNIKEDKFLYMTIVKKIKEEE
jgi:hypothetical protein